MSESEVLQESPVYRKCNSNFTKYNEDDQEINPIPQPPETDPNEDSGMSMKENMDPEDDENTEINPLLGCNKNKEGQDLADEDENHPFTDGESKHTVVSLLDENTN